VGGAVLADEGAPVEAPQLVVQDAPERAPQHRTSLAEHLAHGEGDALILLVEGHLGALDGAVRGRHGGAVDGELRGVGHQHRGGTHDLEVDLDGALERRRPRAGVMERR